MNGISSRVGPTLALAGATMLAAGCGGTANASGPPVGATGGHAHGTPSRHTEAVDAAGAGGGVAEVALDPTFPDTQAGLAGMAHAGRQDQRTGTSGAAFLLARLARR